MSATQEVFESMAGNPDVLIIGLAAGFFLAKAMGRRRRGMMGGGGMF